MTIYNSIGALCKIKDIIKFHNINRVLIVTGKKSFRESGAEQIINDCLNQCEITYFNDFEVNPRLIDAEKGIDLAIKKNIEGIICIGGGSVIDMGKLIKALYINPDDNVNIIQGFSEVVDSNIPIIAAPTTAGSGSESTHFAVVYIGNKKYSLANQCLLPNDIILDGNLILSATKYQKACSALDAMSQSIESAWAVGSNPESQALSFKALELCIKNSSEFVNSSKSTLVAQEMIEAANLAGQAINITKTTAAHAWSYGLTKKYNIPHGHAVWITLPKIFEIHASCNEDSICDPRGLSHLEYITKKLMDILNISEINDIEAYFDNLLSIMDIKADIQNDFHIPKNERLELSTNVNQERMGNNPVVFNHSHINEIFKLS